MQEHKSHGGLDILTLTPSCLAPARSKDGTFPIFRAETVRERKLSTGPHA